MTASNYIIKIVLLGEANVGKTSIVHRFVENKFRGNYKATLGVNLLKKEVDLGDDGIVSAQIWDLGGQENFKSLRKLYLEGSNGALIIFDVTSRKTFEKLNEWIQDFRKARGDELTILIGNKNDLKSKIKITDEEARAYAEKNNMEYISTSAKTGENVEEAFKNLTRLIIKKYVNE